MLTKVEEMIQRRNLLEWGDRVLISHSGGMDSTALLQILYTLKGAYGLHLHVFHLNHLFRQDSARRDALFVKEMASSLHIPCVVETFDVPKYCQERGLGAQEGARLVRYSLLDRVAQETSSNKIALGHQADDQAETVLLNLLRGSGLEGLKGMEPCQGRYIRPLLSIFRHEIEAYCKEKGLPYREDPSNKKEIYLRNRLRLDLIPYIEEHYSQKFQEALVRMSGIVREENNYIQERAEKAFQEVATEVREDELSLDVVSLKGLPLALLRRTLRQAYQALRGSKAGLMFEQVEEIICGLERERWQQSLPGGVRVEKSYKTLTFTKREDTGVTTYAYVLEAPGEIEIPSYGMVLEVREVKKALFQRIKEEGPANLSSLHCIYIDAHKVEFPLTVRTRKEGDVFYPLGLGGKKKVKDFFMDEKIHYQDRGQIPIVTDLTGRIVWIVGLRMSDEVKITTSTKRILSLHLSRRGSCVDKL